MPMGDWADEKERADAAETAEGGAAVLLQLVCYDCLRRMGCRGANWVASRQLAFLHPSHVFAPRDAEA